MMLLKRDERTGAVLNNDLENYNKYKMLRDHNRKISLLQMELSNLKQDLNEIKTILARMETN
jgi:hypothetical protein